MFAAALIVFRETLEAVMIIAIIAAATRGVIGSRRWMALGVGLGLSGAGLVAFFTSAIANFAEGSGQELLNAAVMFAAVFMIGWHVVWMSRHGSAMSAEMRVVGAKVTEGRSHLSILALVIGLAVMREGSEVVLMLQGLLAGSQPAGAALWGGTFGLVSGILLGLLMYAGFSALPIRRVFAATNILLVLIAGGMAARGVNFIAQINALPTLGERVWDTSDLVADNSLTGQLLSALVGYTAQPSGLQLLAYGVTIGVILALLAIQKRISGTRTLYVYAAIALMFFASSRQAGASEVLSPYVVKGEAEIEHQGYSAHDRNPDASGELALTLALGYSPTSFWRTELEGEFEREAGPDQPLRYQAINSENTFQLAEPGEYWIDPAAFVELGLARDGESNAFTVGFLGAKNIGPITDTFNLLLEKDFSPDATPLGLAYRNQVKYTVRPWLEPGFEIFGNTDGKNKFAEQQLAMGPGLFGAIRPFSHAQKLKYQIGYLFGATPATPDGAIHWKLEYEFMF